METENPPEEEGSQAETEAVQKYKELKQRLERDLTRLRTQSAHSIRNPFRNRLQEGSIIDKIKESHEAKKKELENTAFEQDIILKKKTLNRLFWFLMIETIAIFIFSWCQGIKFQGFYLEEWSFRLLVSVTITQITIMLLVAVKHLFPQKN